MSVQKEITTADLNKAISEEIKKFVVENKKEITKRALKRLKAEK